MATTISTAAETTTFCPVTPAGTTSPEKAATTASTLGATRTNGRAEATATISSSRTTEMGMSSSAGPATTRSRPTQGTGVAGNCEVVPPPGPPPLQAPGSTPVVEATITTEEGTITM